MAKDGFSMKVDEKSLKTLNSKLVKEGETISTELFNLLSRAALNIIAYAKGNLRKNNSIATSFLTNSGRVVRKKDYFVAEFTADYSAALEYGRRSGKPPPLDIILAWVKKKGIAASYSIKTKKRTATTKSQAQREKSLAFLIQRSIGQNGTKPHPFFYPAVKQVESIFKREVKQLEKKLEARTKFK